MDETRNDPTTEPAGRSGRWRKSSYSGDNCVEVSLTGDGAAVRNSNRLASPPVTVTGGDLATWLASIKAGHLDDLR